MEQLDSVRQVDAFVLDGAIWPHTEDWQTIFRMAESATTPRVERLHPNLAKPPGWRPRTIPADPVKAAGGSQWEKSFLTVARVDSVAANEASQQLVDVRAWWWANVRGRLYQEPLRGLGFYLTEPPRREAPYPLPDQLTAGDWVDAVQQQAWWVAVHGVEKSRHAARQVDIWQQVQSAAALVYDPEIRQVLGVVQTHTTRATHVAQLRKRAALWA